MQRLDFLSLVFQSSLNVGALLFGVFGLLYSVYATYMQQVNPENPVPAGVVVPLKFFCKIIACLIFLNLPISGYSLWLIKPAGGDIDLLVLGLLSISLVTSSVSLYIAFRSMH